MHSTSPKFSAHFWRVCLVVSSCLLPSVFAHADDLFWGSTDGSKLVEYDASNNMLLSRTFSGQSYTQFTLINNALGGPLTMSGAGGNIQSFAFDPVPEPPISIMLGFGLVCLLGWRYQPRLACA
jgi:hypothetical protein